MKRTAVIGALILMLALFAAPASAQTEGSVLPAPDQAQIIPVTPVQSRVGQAAVTAEVLADTGLDAEVMGLLGGGLVAIGALALLSGRRRVVR